MGRWSLMHGSFATITVSHIYISISTYKRSVSWVKEGSNVGTGGRSIYGDPPHFKFEDENFRERCMSVPGVAFGAFQSAAVNDWVWLKNWIGSFWIPLEHGNVRLTPRMKTVGLSRNHGYSLACAT